MQKYSRKLRLTGTDTKNGSKRRIPIHPRVREMLINLPRGLHTNRVLLSKGKPVNNFAGNIITGKNPSSVVNDGNIIVLCRGIYDENDALNNEESSFSRISAGSLSVDANTILSGIYNADNLCVDESDTRFYFTASDGVYWSDKSSFSSNLITDKKNPNVLISNNETYFDLTDSIYKTVNYLWCNDQDNPNYLYKLNFQTNEFEDSIILNSPIIDLEIYR